MLRLITPQDVLAPIVVFGLCMGVGALVSFIWPAPAVMTTAAKLGMAFAVLLLIVSGSRLSARVRKLRSGHCPYPLCHGVVQHSEKARKGFVLCPTCGHQWPEIPGIQFKATVRQ